MARQTRASTAYQLKRRQYWKQMISKWKQSGLSQARFCRRYKLQTQQFSKWKVRLAKNSNIPAKEPTPKVNFIELKSSVSPGVYEIITPGEYRIRMEGDCCPEMLSHILSAVSRSC